MKLTADVHTYNIRGSWKMFENFSETGCMGDSKVHLEFPFYKQNDS